MARVYVTGTPQMVEPNTPQPSRHVLESDGAHKWLSTMGRAVARAWRPFAGISWTRPPLAHYDLIHALNTVPVLATRPWVLTFESWLPRTLGMGGDTLGRAIRDRLADDRCRVLIAMSWYARGKFVKQQQGWPLLRQVLEKVTVVYPHAPDSSATQLHQLRRGEPLRLVFVGNDFARKGGIVALRVMQRARARGLPLTLDIVSRFRIGRGVFMDHPDHRRYAHDLQLLELPGVTVRGSVSHAEVLRTLAHSHVQLMTSLDDTFGYSVIEGYAMGTPAITTNVCALAETVIPGETGFRVDLPIDEWGNWIYRDGRDRPDYWEILDTTYDALAAQVVVRLEELVDEPRMHGALCEGALQRARSHHDPRRTSAALDELYDRALA